MHDEQLRPVLDRLLATRRAKAEDTQGGARKGLRILFAGYSGKNKLLAAQLFAHELSVDLIQIDLERIVSKYVGDTEKNLDALFKAAEASDAGAHVRRHGSPVCRRIVHRGIRSLSQPQRRPAATAHRKLRRRRSC
jgi:hypothetical protein